MKTGCIYRIWNTLNGKSYIGITMRNPEIRINQHLSGLTPGCKAINYALQHYGKEAFKHEIIERNVPQRQLSERENYWIDQLDTLSPNGYNLIRSGEITYQMSAYLKSGVYCIRHVETGKCYVGASKDIKRRWSGHRWAKRSSFIQKYGLDSFVFEILELCPERDLGSREQFWIASLNTLHPNGFNLRYGGAHGGRHSVMSRQNQSEARKKKWEDPEYRRKTSEAHQGKIPTDETRKKRSESMKKICADPEFNEKRAESIKKASRTPESRKRRSEAAKKFWSTPEGRRKKKESIMKRWANPEERKKASERMKKRNAERRKKSSPDQLS